MSHGSSRSRAARSCRFWKRKTRNALLSALASLGRVYVGPAAGALADAYGWMTFFFLTFLVALPGVALLWWLRARIDSLDAEAKA